jgi:hypothetical protein
MGMDAGMDSAAAVSTPKCVTIAEARIKFECERVEQERDRLEQERIEAARQPDMFAESA